MCHRLSLSKPQRVPIFFNANACHHLPHAHLPIFVSLLDSYVPKVPCVYPLSSPHPLTSHVHATHCRLPTHLHAHLSHVLEFPCKQSPMHVVTFPLSITTFSKAPFHFALSISSSLRILSLSYQGVRKSHLTSPAMAFACLSDGISTKRGSRR